MRAVVARRVAETSPFHPPASQSPLRGPARRVSGGPASPATTRSGASLRPRSVSVDGRFRMGIAVSRAETGTAPPPHGSLRSLPLVPWNKEQSDLEEEMRSVCASRAVQASPTSGARTPCDAPEAVATFGIPAHTTMRRLPVPGAPSNGSSRPGFAPPEGAAQSGRPACCLHPRFASLTPPEGAAQSGRPACCLHPWFASLTPPEGAEAARD